jgi:aspartyl-tRNA(Asn)/glutamyl-tRNA(Gln) amidotransferase subunit C
MAFNEADIVKIARLARIRLGEGEAAHYAREMSSILGWIEQLQAVNTEGVAPLASVSNQTLPWRKDEVTEGGIAPQILANAPQQNYGCFAVPKVIE